MKKTSMERFKLWQSKNLNKLLLFVDISTNTLEQALKLFVMGFGFL
jgi:hypothetical protein